MDYAPPGYRHFLDQAIETRAAARDPEAKHSDDHAIAQAAAVGPLQRVFRNITNASYQTLPALAEEMLALCEDEFETLRLATETCRTGLAHAFEGLGIAPPAWIPPEVPPPGEGGGGAAPSRRAEGAAEEHTFTGTAGRQMTAGERHAAADEERPHRGRKS